MVADKILRSHGQLRRQAKRNSLALFSLKLFSIGCKEPRNQALRSGLANAAGEFD